MNCDRDGHGHGTEDGNFAHVSGLYTLLAALRERFPALVIENCASGGNRLDLGMARHTDVAWMDDRTAPSAHVRRNLAGLTTIFPPAYLLSFVVDAGEEPLHEAADLALIVRSRMPGAVGLAFAEALLAGEEQDEVARELAVYKALREVQAQGRGIALTARPGPGQAGEAGQSGWEVIEEVAADQSCAVVFAFQVDAQARAFTVRPAGLRPEARYEVRSVDTGVLGTLSGAAIMASGIEVAPWSRSAAHIVVLRVVAEEGAGLRGPDLE